MSPGNLNNFSERRHNPAVFWVLIVVLMMILGGAVKILGNSNELISQIPTPVPAESREARIYTIYYNGGVFSPTNLRIHAGDTVRFKNESFFSIRIVSDSQVSVGQLPLFDSIGDIPQGSYFSFTFSDKGTFGYHNGKNPDEQGSIIVR